MRLLIAAGGTGGHIYPALAVAQSLRAQPDAPELAWVGGHRGLESQLVRSAAPPIPLRRLALRSLRSVDASAHTVTRSRSASRLSVPQATAMLLRERPDAIFTTGGYVAHRRADGGRAAADPDGALGRQRGPRPQRPHRRPARRPDRCELRGDLPGARAGGRLLPDRNPDPRHRRRSTASRRAPRWASGRPTGCS